jgi:hypothetical protein
MLRYPSILKAVHGNVGTALVAFPQIVEAIVQNHGVVRGNYDLCLN